MRDSNRDQLREQARWLIRRNQTLLGKIIRTLDLEKAKALDVERVPDKERQVWPQRRSSLAQPF